LLKKIATKLATHIPDEFYIDGEDEEPDAENSPHLRIHRKSDASMISKTSRRSRGRKRHAKANDDSDIEYSKLSQQSNENLDEEDFTPNMIEKEFEDAFNENAYHENSSSGFKDNSRKEKGVKKKIQGISKDSESQRTFMMNIQTTADLISYVKRRQKKYQRPTNKQKQLSRKILGYGKIRQQKYPGHAGISHIRHFPLYPQQAMLSSKSIEIQTDDLDILDLRVSEINLSEVYYFDRVSSCLKKIVIERGVDAEILRQFEYIHKDTIHSKYISRVSIVGRYGKSLNKQDQFKKNIAENVTKGEINRYNDALKAFMMKIKDYEHETAYLEEKRSCISSEFPLFKESEQDVFNRGWRKGYSAGYSRGNSTGFFKGSLEAQYIGHQKGIEEGMQEGWNFGFDEGFKTGIRKVFRDAREAGIDLSSLELMEYISHEDRIKGLMKNLYNKLTKGRF
jgi:flagellar biosynthesis/type III secretory pathway protein FliH